MAINKLIIENSNGSVGIGTTNPSKTLHTYSSAESLLVDGSASWGAALQIKGGGGANTWQLQSTGTGAGEGANKLVFVQKDAELVAMTLTSSGTVGVGITSPYSRLTVTAASVSWGEGITINPAPNGYSAVYFRTEGAQNSSYTNSWAIGKNASGQTGGELLHVVREQLTGSSLHRVDAIQSWQTGGNSCFGFNVGIGTTSPGQKLDVAARVRFRSDGNVSAGHWLTDSSGTENVFTGLQGASASSAWGVWTNSAWRLTITYTDGNVGIGTTNPGVPLQVRGAGTSNTYRGVIRIDNSSAQQWAGLSFPDSVTGSDVASNNYYFIGRGNSIADRVFSIHMPNAADYGSGVQPKFGVFSTGSDTLFTVESSTGLVFAKGGLNIDGTIGFRRGSGDYGTYIRSNGYPAQGYANADGTKYWVEMGSAGGVHVVLNTDSGAGADENSFDHFTIWQGSNNGDRLFHVTNVGNVVARGNITNQSWKGHTFIPLSSVATKTFTVTGNSQGNFPTTDFSGIPSNAKALLVYGWYHINGYSSSGYNDHATSWFGWNADASIITWADPSLRWPGGNTFSALYHGSFIMMHDGDNSGAPLYYGAWFNGIICPNSNGNIYYNIAHGYSGGTHYNALYCVGYWI